MLGGREGRYSKQKIYRRKREDVREKAEGKGRRARVDVKGGEAIQRLGRGRELLLRKAFVR